MATQILIKGATLVNEGRMFQADVLIDPPFISQISEAGIAAPAHATIIDGTGRLLLPGAIDDQVHFRWPGLTHKADIGTESAAAVAGGVTSFMEMPNTNPPTLTQALLAEKYAMASQVSYANYSFYMGGSNTNLEEVLATDITNVCGIKLFLGSSTGDMLMDDEDAIYKLFSLAPCIISTHCEDEPRVKARAAQFKERYGDNVPVDVHAQIRDVDSCYLNSSKTVAMAKETGARLNVLHITTAKELELFEPGSNPNKMITAEACVHHLWYTADDYARLGDLIKCNPSIKAAENRDAIWQAINDGRIDLIATDHAPHTMDEKKAGYWKAPAGLPLIQFSYSMMLQAARDGRTTIETVVEKMAHAPARLFQVDRRGFLREGYYADLVLVETDSTHVVTSSEVLYKCGWSPLEGEKFTFRVEKTIVNGSLVYTAGQHPMLGAGQRLQFTPGSSRRYRR